MTEFKQVEIEQFNKNPFVAIGQEWMLITASHNGKINTMTASWGGLGVLWNKNVAFIVIRPTRYTKQFVDNSSTFSLSFFDQKYKDQLGYLGSVSGKDVDKIKISKLETCDKDATPYFTQANTVLLCQKLYAQEFTPQSFVDDKLCKEIYKNNDYHTLYVGEITKILVKQELK
ncbi:MAG: flavin reductase [Clostridia bacterium]